VIRAVVALTILAGTPLNRTSRFCGRLSNCTPSIVTVVVGGPLAGVTPVIAGIGGT